MNLKLALFLGCFFIGAASQALEGKHNHTRHKRHFPGGAAHPGRPKRQPFEGRREGPQAVMSRPVNGIQKLYGSQKRIPIDPRQDNNGHRNVKNHNIVIIDDNMDKVEEVTTQVPHINVILNPNDHGESILTCNTVKCKGGNRCIMTRNECINTFKFDPLIPTNCESKPKCVPDKVCKACGPNEHRTRCSICEKTCENPTRNGCKVENICGQKSRCICDEGFARNSNGKCIPENECPQSGEPTTPEDYYVVIKKEKNEKHEQIDLLNPKTTEKPGKGPGKVNSSTKKPEDDGLIIVKEKENKSTEGNGKPKTTTKKPSDDDGLIIVNEKGHKQTRKPSNVQTTKKTTTKKPDDGLIIVNEKKNNHNQKPKPSESSASNDDKEFFIVKKKVQNNKHGQIDLM